MKWRKIMRNAKNESQNTPFIWDFSIQKIPFELRNKRQIGSFDPNLRAVFGTNLSHSLGGWIQNTPNCPPSQYSLDGQPATKYNHILYTYVICRLVYSLAQMTKVREKKTARYVQAAGVVTAVWSNKGTQTKPHSTHHNDWSNFQSVVLWIG